MRSDAQVLEAGDRQAVERGRRFPRQTVQRRVTAEAGALCGDRHGQAGQPAVGVAVGQCVQYTAGAGKRLVVFAAGDAEDSVVGDVLIAERDAAGMTAERHAESAGDAH